MLAAVASALLVGLQRERQLADPPVRDRRVHGVHALAGGDGALLARGRTIPAGAIGRSLNGVGARATGVVTLIVICDEVRRGRLARDRRDPAARARRCSGSAATTGASRAGSTPASARSAPPARRRTDVLLWVESLDAAAEGGSGTRGRSPATRRSARCSPRAGIPIRGSGRAGSTSPRTAADARERSPRRGARRRRCSSRSGGCRAASRTSSPWSSRSSSSAVARSSVGDRADVVPLKLRLLSEPGVVVADVRSSPTAAAPRA